MPEKEKEEGIKTRTINMVKDARNLHALTQKKRELVSMIYEREKNVDHAITKNVNEMREMERKKRLKEYGSVENNRQKITSGLMIELMSICENTDVPTYVLPLARVLDNFQGKTFLYTLYTLLLSS